MTGTTDQTAAGPTALGVEFGSTRIKACLIGPDHAVLASGSHDWENQLVDGVWTYSLEAVRTGLQAAVAALLADCRERGVEPRADALGVSAMMHGYLAFDAAGELQVPFRTWRNTSTGPAAAALTDLLGVNIPLRWSVAHRYQAVLDAEPHVAATASLTTLAGYVHRLLTGRHVLGVGDASGMFPLDAAGGYDAALLARYDALVGDGSHLADLLPAVLGAGEPAGELTAAGAALLDPSGTLLPGIPVCPPEGDAGTGMVATNAVAPRTGNVSAGTSIFAMVVMERPLAKLHHEIDVVTTPAGDPVAMVHCNNGASEIEAWAGIFRQFAAALGHPASADDTFAALFAAALDGEADAGGLLAYNYLAGEPVAGLDAGRPLVVRTPDSTPSLANFMRAQLYGMFGTLSLGMEVLAAEGVEVDSLLAHGGVFRTAGVAQRFLAAAVGTPVTVAATAAEGGPWGMAVLAAYLLRGEGLPLGEYLATRVFHGGEAVTVEPGPADVAGYAAYLERYRAGLAVERAAAESV